jgi:hypothetical protein
MLRFAGDGDFICPKWEINEHCDDAKVTVVQLRVRCS